jgi:hypothetical protein
VFVESSGEPIGLIAAGQGAADGGGGTGKGQTKKNPKTPRFPNVKEKQFLHISWASLQEVERRVFGKNRQIVSRSPE